MPFGLFEVEYSSYNGKFDEANLVQIFSTFLFNVLVHFVKIVKDYFVEM